MTKTRQKLFKKKCEIDWSHLWLQQFGNMQWKLFANLRIKLIGKNSWNHKRWTYSWRVLDIWNLCAASSSLWRLWLTKFCAAAVVAMINEEVARVTLPN
jgi:hypothetical protein